MEEDLSLHLQDAIARLSITDTKFAKAVYGQLKPEYLQSEMTQLVFKISMTFLEKYGRAPSDGSDHFHDELLQKVKGLSSDKRKLLAEYVLKLQRTRPPDSKYVLDQVNNFIQSRTLLGVTYDFAELVDHGHFDKARHLMFDALKAGIQTQNAGLNYLKDYSGVLERGTRPSRLVNIGIPLLDPVVGLEKQDLVIIAGPQKGMKSWFGHHLGRMGLFYGLNVLHVSHENRLEICEIRYDMMIGALLNEAHPREVEIRKLLAPGEVEVDLIKRGTVYDKKKVISNRKKMSKFGGNLVIRKYPMGTCTPIDLENLVDYLENFEGFKVDLVITDYADIMAPVSKKEQSRDAINEIYIHLNRIADARRLVMVTMSQINDDGLVHLMRTGSFEGRFLAEDKRKLANADKGFFVGRTPLLMERGEAVVGCFANRNGHVGTRVIIGQNLSIGQFCTYGYHFDEALAIEDSPRRGRQNSED